MSIAFSISPNSLTIVIDGKIRTYMSDDKRYEELTELIRQSDKAGIMAVIDRPEKEIEVFEKIVQAGVTVELKNGYVFLDGKLMQDTLSAQILGLSKRGLPVKHLMNFMARVSRNKRYQTRLGLYDWIIRNDMPIMSDGRFLAFKVVQGDLWDIYTGRTFKHEVGAVIQMDEGEVDDDSNQTCSAGAHFCAENYIRSYASKDRDTDVICGLAVDPADVIVFPSDYVGTGKARAWRYTVEFHMSREEASKYFEDRSRIVYGDEEYEDEDEYFDNAL